MTNREQVYNKYNGKCAFSGTVLQDDWLIDRIVPKIYGGTDNIDNLLPVQRIIKHYRRALPVADFRRWYITDLHKRLAKLPKNPRTIKSKKRKAQLLEFAELFGITAEKPFTGKFHFEEIE